MASRSRGLSIPFFAGIIDARGHIEIAMRHDKPQPRLAVTTKRVDLLEWMAKVTGTRVSLDNRGYERRPCGEHCHEHHSHVVRQSAKWRVDSSRATIVLFNIAPHIVGQRKEVLEALRIGLLAWPTARSDTAAAMAKLGWALPGVEVEATPLGRGGTTLSSTTRNAAPTHREG